MVEPIVPRRGFGGALRVAKGSSCSSCANAWWYAEPTACVFISVFIVFVSILLFNQTSRRLQDTIG